MIVFMKLYHHKDDVKNLISNNMASSYKEIQGTEIFIYKLVIIFIICEKVNTGKNDTFFKLVESRNTVF